MNHIVHLAQSTGHIDPGMVIIVGIVFGLGVPLVAQYWYKLRVKQWEMSLKHTMLERGMSADEIKTVLETSAMRGERKTACWSHSQHTGSEV